MMTYEELYRLKIQPEGQDKVDALKSALQRANDECDQAVLKYGTASASVKAYTKIIDDLEKALTRATVKAEDKANREAAAAQKSADAVAKAAAAKKASWEQEANDARVAAAVAQTAAAKQAAAASGTAPGSKGGGGKSGVNAQGLMQISYFLDDVQYGIRGVANNIPGLLNAVGVVGKLAGAFSIASAAAVLLYNHWDSIVGLFGMGATQTEAERMEELGKKTEKTAEETRKLTKYEENLSNQRAQRGKSKEESALTDEVNSAVTELGDENAVRGMVQLRRGRYVNADPEMSKLEAKRKRQEKDLQTLQRMGYAGTNAKAELDATTADLEGRLDKAARADLAAAASDPAKKKALEALVQGNPGAFGPGGAAFADNLGKRAREAADAAKDRDAKAQDAEEAAAQKAQEEEDKRRLEAADMEDAANQDRDNQQREEFRKARSKKFEAARDSGLGPLIADQLAAAMKQGGDISPLKKALQERLTATFGLAAGPAMLKDAETDAKRQVMLDWVNGKDEKHRNSAVMSGGADWARTIQAGVGGGKDREQLQRLDRIAAVLAEQLKVAKEAKAQPPAPGRAFVGK